MKKFGLSLMTCTLILLSSLSAVAQFNNRNNNNNNNNRNGRNIVEIRRGTPSISAGLQLGIPQTEFNHRYGNVLYGYYGQLMLNVGRSPFEFGAKASFLTMDSQREDIYLFEGVTQEGNESFEDGSMRATATARNYMAVARLEPLRKRVQIYGDLMAGMATYGLRTKTRADNYGRNEIIDRNLAYSNSVMSYGWAVGLKIELIQDLMIEGRFENLRGGNATFVDPSTVTIGQEGELNYDFIESTTDMYNISLGLSFEF